MSHCYHRIKCKLSSVPSGSEIQAVIEERTVIGIMRCGLEELSRECYKDHDTRWSNVDT